ncbi:MAG: COR domain-containing protein [Bacteroidia bacterium]
MRALNLSENKLKELRFPAGMVNVETLNVEDNTLTFPTEETTKQGGAAILRFLTALASQGESQVYEVKMLIVGEGGTGKTTLWNKLQNPNHKVPDETQLSTVGISIREGWQFDHPNFPGTPFLVNLWDFGGQEIQYMTHQFFLTRRSFYVLLADGRREVANFPYWFKIIDLLGYDPKQEKKLPVLVILNERGTITARWPYDPEAAKIDYPRLDVIKRDVDFAKKDDRLEGLTRAIKNILCEYMTHLPWKIPSFWSEVRKELYKLRKTVNHITYTRFEEICREKGINEELQMSDLSQMLHDLGIILHYHEDLNLSDLMILNPEWAVNAVYEILKHEEVKNNQGRFEKELLLKIWSEKKYTREEQRHLMNLMLKDSFEVCFQAEEEGKTVYIAPQLLPDIRPHFPWDRSAKTLRYTYQYPFMPKGIIGRLIVRLHPYISVQEEKKIVWEKGILVIQESCQALVEETEDGKTGSKIIAIEVRGAHDNSRYLLHRIRKELEHIHTRSFPTLKFEEKIPCCCESCVSSNEPHFFDLSVLISREQKGKQTIECVKSGEDVSIRDLRRGVFSQLNLDHIRVLVENDDLENALNSFKSYAERRKDSKLIDQISLVISQLNRYENDFRKGLLVDHIELNKIRESILHLLTFEGKEYLQSRVVEFEKELSEKPDDSEIWLELFSVYRKLNREEEAQRAFDQYEKIQEEKFFKINLSAPVVLKEFKVDGIRFFQSLRLKFQPNINILLGKNGFGKSHFMRLLAAFLLKENDLIDKYFQKCKPEANIALYIEQGEDEKSIKRSPTAFVEHYGRIPVLAIPDSRFINRSVSQLSPLSVENSDLRSNGAFHFLHQKPYESIIQTFLYQLCISYLEKGKSFDQPVFKLVKNILNSLSDSDFEFYEIKSLDNAMFEIWVHTEGNRDIPILIQHASQGTLSIISVFGLIFFYLRSIYPDIPDDNLLKQRAIVFIDELDAHLHPSWQQKIIALLRRIFPQIQFIISAHSPLIVSGCFSGEVSVMRKRGKVDDFGIQQYEGDFIGAMANELYEKVFEIEEGLDNYQTVNSIFKEDWEKEITELELIEETGELTPKQQNRLSKLYDDLYHLNKFLKVRISKEKTDSLEEKLKNLLLENERLKLELEKYFIPETNNEIKDE